jgi:hypothetical protein
MSTALAASLFPSVSLSIETAPNWAQVRLFGGEAVSARGLHAAALSLAAHVELATPAEESWIVTVVRAAREDVLFVRLEYIVGDDREVAAARTLLAGMVAGAAR